MKKKLMALILTLTAATALGTFAACGEAHEHTYGEWEITITPTTTQTGLITRTCTGDSAHKESVILPALNSVDYTMVETEATCTLDGGIYYTLNDDTYLINGEHIVISILDGSKATGHDLTHVEAVSVTCTTDGNTEYWHCANCDGYFTDEDAANETTLADVTLTAAGHDYGTGLSYTDGKWYQICANCNDTVEITDTENYTLLAGDETSLAAAIATSSADIKLTADIEITATAFAGSVFTESTSVTDTDILIDVAGNALTVSGSGVLYVVNGNSLTFTDSANTDGSASTDVALYLNNNTSTGACLNIQSGSTVTMEDIVVSSTGSVLFPKGDAAAVNVINSRISTSGVYGVGTNAASSDNYGVVITIDGSYLETTASDSDSCVVMINIPGTLTITDSTISGQRQGVIARGGTVSISDTTISTSGTYTGSYYLDGNWGGGNEVPLAALVVGNRHANSYHYATTIALSNVTLVVADGANSNAVTMYVYGDDTSSDIGVTMTYDSGCSLGSYVVGGGSVTINGSAASATTASSD